MTDNRFFITRIQEQITKDNEDKVREKKSFWASDCEKPLFDLYHAWIGTPPTNPIEAEKLIMFSAGKMIELALVNVMVKSGIAQKLDNQLRIEMEREGVPVSGYIDALDLDGNPIEIKSFYGDYQAKELKAGQPKEAYLKQLAVYMDFLGKDKGTLIYMDRGTGEVYQFTLIKTGLKFKCASIEFDLSDTYKRWAKLYKENILPKIEPKSEYRYKIPVEEVDWKSLSKTDIGKARNNNKVIGDHPYLVSYSSYKNLIIEKEGTTLGYTDDELKKIAELTAGYTTWK